MRMRGNAPKVKLEVWAGYKENIFPHEDSQTMEKVSKEVGCLFFGDFQDPVG